MAIPALIGAGASLLGGVLQGRSARRAAQTQADAQRDAARMAAEEARFRPVGVTTRFGRSDFTTGPDGRVSGASYTLDPTLRGFQDRFMGLAGGGVGQAEMAQEQFAPLGQAGQGLFNLGQQYLAQSPQEAAQQYMAGQQNLLAPSRERQFAQVQNNLFNTGRGGLAVGATGARPDGGAGLGASSPEMEAYFNAIAQQDAQLAAGAQQAGMDQARFGAGLFATGGNLIDQSFRGQTAALGPFEAYLRQMKQLEALGQQPLDIGMNIGAKGQSPAAAQAMLSTGPTQQSFQANAFNPFARTLMSLGNNRQFGEGLSNLFSRSSGTFTDVGGVGAASLPYEFR